MMLTSASSPMCLLDEHEAIYGLKYESVAGEKTWVATTAGGRASLMRCNGDRWAGHHAEWSVYVSPNWLNALLNLLLRITVVHFTYAFMTSFRRAKSSPNRKTMLIDCLTLPYAAWVAQKCAKLRNGMMECVRRTESNMPPSYCSNLINY